MAEGLSAISTKAVDELSGKVFIPGAIAALLVEYGDYYQLLRPSASFIEIYSVLAVVGLIGSYLVLTILMWCLMRFNSFYKVPSYIGLLIMPLGFLGVFPEYFPMIEIPYSPVTGMAIVAWAFFLINNDVIEYLFPELKTN